ncbi:MAG: methyltransferase domain-containing protein [Mariprofundales bacterium]
MTISKKYFAVVDAAWNKLRPAVESQIERAEREQWTQVYIPSIHELQEYIDGSRDRFALLSSLLDAVLPTGARILDAGCGHGMQVLALQGLGYSVEASDVHDGLPLFDDIAVSYQRWHLEGENAPWVQNSFDAIVLSQAIEHFTYSPANAIKEMLRMLKPGGYLLIDAPNISCFHNVSRLIRGRSLHWNFKKHYLDQQPQLFAGVPYYDRHNHEYSMEDLHDIATCFTLEIAKSAYYSSYNHKKCGAITIFL